MAEGFYTLTTRLDKTAIDSGFARIKQDAVKLSADVKRVFTEVAQGQRLEPPKPVFIPPKPADISALKQARAEVAGLVAAEKLGAAAAGDVAQAISRVTGELVARRPALKDDAAGFTAVSKAITSTVSAAERLQNKQVRIDTREAQQGLDALKVKLANLKAEEKRGAITSQEAARASDQLTRELVEQRSALEPATRLHKQYSDAIRQSATASQQFTRQSSGLVSSVNSIAGGLASLATVNIGRNLSSSLVEIATESFTAQNSLKLLELQAGRAGLVFSDVSEDVNATADRLKVSEERLSGVFAGLLRIGGDSDLISQALEGASASALLLGKDTTTALGNVESAVASLQSQQLNAIGISENFDKAIRDYAKSIGKSREELSRAEETNAALNLIISATQGEVTELDTLLGGFGGTVADNTRAAEQFRTEYGQFVQPVLARVYETGTQLLEFLTDLPTPLKNAAAGTALLAAGAATLVGGLGTIGFTVVGLTSGLSALSAAGIGAGAGLTATGAGATTAAAGLGAVAAVAGPIVATLAAIGVGSYALNRALDAGKASRAQIQVDFQNIIKASSAYRSDLGFTTEAERQSLQLRLERQKEYFTKLLALYQAQFDQIQAQVVAFANEPLLKQLFGFGAANVNIKALEQVEGQINSLKGTIAGIDTDIGSIGVSFDTGGAASGIKTLNDLLEEQKQLQNELGTATSDEQRAEIRAEIDALNSLIDAYRGVSGARSGSRAKDPIADEAQRVGAAVDLLKQKLDQDLITRDQYESELEAHKRRIEGLFGRVTTTEQATAVLRVRASIQTELDQSPEAVKQELIDKLFTDLGVAGTQIQQRLAIDLELTNDPTEELSLRLDAATERANLLDSALNSALEAKASNPEIENLTTRLVSAREEADRLVTALEGVGLVAIANAKLATGEGVAGSDAKFQPPRAIDFSGGTDRKLSAVADDIAERISENIERFAESQVTRFRIQTDQAAQGSDSKFRRLAEDIDENVLRYYAERVAKTRVVSASAVNSSDAKFTQIEQQLRSDILESVRVLQNQILTDARISSSSAAVSSDAKFGRIAEDLPEILEDQGQFILGRFRLQTKQAVLASDAKFKQAADNLVAGILEDVQAIGVRASTRQRFVSSDAVAGSDAKFTQASGTSGLSDEFFDRQRQASELAEEATKQAAEQQKAAAQQFAQTVVGAAGQVGDLLLQAASGNLSAGDAVSGFGGAAASILTAIDPLIGALVGVGSSLIGGLLNLSNNDEEERRRAQQQRAARSVPAININFNQNNQFNYSGQPGAPATNQAVARDADTIGQKTFNLIEQNLIPRLERLETFAQAQTT